MIEAAVIGSPISHSLSPMIFSFLAERMGRRDFKYRAREVTDTELKSFVSELRTNPSMIGVNVTIPHKEALLSFLDELSDEARAIGAVNVVHLMRSHRHPVDAPLGVARLVGYNTDVIGVIRALEESRFSVPGKNAWIFGAGGAARAVAYALGKLGAREVVIHNRSTERSRKLIETLTPIFPATRFVDASSGGFALIVNATSVGMRNSRVGGAFDAFSSILLESDAVAFDLIYNPARTQFMELAERRGLRAVNGLGMLVHQALATWEIWLGALESKETLRSALESKLSAHLESERPVFLTGLMGSGKSAVGALLARRLGWNFLDSDAEVERVALRSIPDIFSDEGEASFREREKEVLAKAVSLTKTVVSLGGGALMDPESLERVERSGRLVYLKAKVRTLADRVRAQAGTRPLLRGLDAQAQEHKLGDLLEARKSAYERAHFTVDTDSLSADQVSEKLFAWLGGSAA